MTLTRPRLRLRSTAATVALAVSVALVAGGCGDGTRDAAVTATTVPPATSTPSSTAASTVTTSAAVPTTATGAPTIVDDVLQGASEADRYTYELKFPKVQGLADPDVQVAVNAAILTEVAASVDEFIGATKDFGAPPPAVADQRSSLTGTYAVARLDDGLASVGVRVSRFFAGAAHPGSVLLTFNFDLHTGRRLALSDLFVAGSPYLAKLSELSRELLATQPGMSDLADFVLPGTEPTAENFAGWTLTDQDLVITFAEYQVAPYAMGTPHVSIPFASIRTLLDPAGPLAIHN